jgi:hypothetical protein
MHVSNIVNPKDLPSLCIPSLHPGFYKWVDLLSCSNPHRAKIYVDTGYDI